MAISAWYQTAADAPASLQQIDPEALGDAPVAIAVERSAINYKDALALTASAPIARSLPLVLGIDLAGTVTASSDPRFNPGDRVLATGWGMGERSHGGLATAARCQGDWLTPLPTGTDADWAMGLGTAGLTAALAVERIQRCGLPPEAGPIAVTGATGGVGSIAVALLAALGYEVHAISGKPAEHAALITLGANQCLDRTVLQAGKILDRTRFAGAVDTLGAEPLAALLAQIMPQGVVSACGNAAGMTLPTSVAPFILRGVQLHGIDSVMAPTDLRAALWNQLATTLPHEALAPWRSSIALDQAASRAASMLAGTSTGRCIVRCD
ncbi:MAG: acryloyl-CoA reductase [Planctomycetota bacterium]|jgi:acrylyl-CoA reductase (NADPH)|nr:acryloyl-CoA reductase [Planctomycetota bacterium]